MAATTTTPSTIATYTTATGDTVSLHPLAEVGGYRQSPRFASATGTLVDMYDGKHEDSTFEGLTLRYAVVCEYHQNHGEARTYADARALLAHPETYCPQCADIVAGKAPKIGHEDAVVYGPARPTLREGLVAKNGRIHRANCKRVPADFVGAPVDGTEVAATCCKPKGDLFA